MNSEPGLPPSRTRPPTTVIAIATLDQLNYITELVKALHQTENSPYYLAVLKRAIGRTRIRTADEASTVIDILRRLVERHQGASSGTGSRGRNGNHAA